MEQRKRKVGQDIVVKKKISQPVIKKQDISVASKKNDTIKQSSSPVITKRQEHILQTLEYQPNYHRSEISKTPTRGGFLWYVVGLLIVVLFFTLSSAVGKVHTVITLSESTQEIEETIPLAEEPLGGQLGYNTATVIEEYQHSPVTEIQESVSEKATGTIKIINTGTQSVLLPRQTVVVSTNGTRFIIEQEKRIPAGTTKTPASSDVVIVAENPGDESNIGFDDFTFPAYPLLTARTVREIQGGFIGTRQVITEPERLLARTIIQSKFDASNPQKYLINQTPSEFILPEDLITVGPIEITEHIKEGRIHFIGKRTIQGVLLKKQDIFDQLTNRFIGDQENLENNYEKTKLTFALSGTPGTPDFSLLIKGQLVTQYTVAKDSLQQQFAGEKVKEIVKQTRTLPGIIDISTKVTPPWLFTVPEKQSRFTIEVRHFAK